MKRPETGDSIDSIVAQHNDGGKRGKTGKQKKKKGGWEKKRRWMELHCEGEIHASGTVEVFAFSRRFTRHG